MDTDSARRSALQRVDECSQSDTHGAAAPSVPEGYPDTESDYTPGSKEILPEHWIIILNEVERSFEEVTPDQYFFGRFMMLYNYVRSKKKEGQLPLTNNTIKDALSTIVEEGLLIRQEDESYRMAEDYDQKKDEFTKRMNE